MIRRFAALSAAALLALATACSDRPEPTAVGDRALHSASPDLDGQITSLLSTAFPQGLSSASLARWSSVKRLVAANQHQTVKGTQQPAQAGRKQLAELVKWIQRNEPSVMPPAGETQDHVVARIVLYMSLYVYSGPTTTVPDLPAGSDVGVGIITPAAGGTVQTPTLHAGTKFPAGAVDEETIVVIAQNPTPYLTPWTGPLNTTLCQWPQFYKFNVFPDVRLNHSATAAVCHVNSGSFRNPREGIHDRFRLAHDAPPENARVQGGEIVDGIEILPLVFDLSLIDCTQNDTYSPSFSEIGSTDMLHRGLRTLERVANAIGRVITPKSAYAIDQGGGGLVDEFSNFNVVDPDGVPDLRINATNFSVNNVQPVPGDTITLSPFSITNVGDANAGAFVQTFFIATDTTLTNLATPLGPSTNYAGIVVGGEFFVGNTQLMIPVNQAPGVYYVGVRVATTAITAAPAPANPTNYMSVRITVVSPGIIGNTP
jgi:hypothetical protein